MMMKKVNKGGPTTSRSITEAQASVGGQTVTACVHPTENLALVSGRTCADDQVQDCLDLKVLSLIATPMQSITFVVLPINKRLNSSGSKRMRESSGSGGMTSNTGDSLSCLPYMP